MSNMENDNPWVGLASSGTRIDEPGSGTDSRTIRIDPGLSFPSALFEFLFAIGDDSDLASFQPHGRAFHVHDRDRFSRDFFASWSPDNQVINNGDWEAFEGLLNRFSFRMLRSPGLDQGAYYHELFLRGQQFLAWTIQEVAGGDANNEMEPDFSTTPHLASWANYRYVAIPSLFPSWNPANASTPSRGWQPAEVSLVRLLTQQNIIGGLLGNMQWHGENEEGDHGVAEQGEQ